MSVVIIIFAKTVSGLALKRCQDGYMKKVKKVKTNMHLKNGNRDCMGSELLWLMKWFASQFDGYWEHWYGIILDTKETPGWNLMISIDETALEDEIFAEIQEKTSEDTWLHCFVEDKKFKGSCSPCNVAKMLRAFREWAEPFSEEIELNTKIPSHNEETFQWLLNWYVRCCNNGLSCKRRIMISTLENPGWDLHIDLRNTNLEKKEFSYLKVERTEDYWYHCFVRDGIFNGPCGYYNFFETLEVFKKFATDSA